MEFKKLGAVEMVEAVDQAATVLIEKDGVIKRAPKNEIGAQADWAEADSSSPAFIKNKPHRELMYEWNFSADNEVYEILENVNDDLTWLFTKSDDVNFEIVATQYGRYEYQDYDDWVQAIDDSVTTSVVLVNKDYHYKNEQCSQISCGGWGIDGYYDIEKDTVYNMSGVVLQALNKMHFNFEDGTLMSVNVGGTISVSATEGGPFKSVKIYKAIH